MNEVVGDLVRRFRTYSYDVLNEVAQLAESSHIKPDATYAEIKRHSLVEIGSQNSIHSTSGNPPQTTGAAKTELSTLLVGSSLKNPANVKAVILWEYQAKHPTDLDARKGERVRILHKNGDLAFVENSQAKQGFVPLGYCTLYRRRSSSLSDLSADFVRRASTSEQSFAKEDTTRIISIAESHPKGGQIKTQETNSLKKKKRFEAMFSRGTYNARSAEKRDKKKTDKGILNNAAKRLVKAFTSIPKKSKTKPKISVKERMPLPTWLTELHFDTANPDYSSSSDSSDDDADSAYESFRPGYEKRPGSRRRRGSMNSIVTHSSVVSVPEEASLSPRRVDGGLVLSSEGQSDYSSQEIATGFANVRKLKTKSTDCAKGVFRSRSFNLDAKTRTMKTVWRQRPKDLIEISDDETKRPPEQKEAQSINSGNSFKPEQFANASSTNNNYTTKVLNDFKTTESKDLGVVAGQMVRVLNTSNNEWWLCEAEDGRAGFVPRSCFTAEPAGFSGTESGDKVGSLGGEDQGLIYTRERNDWQDSSFRSKSIKLARITPMAREPLLEQFDTSDDLKNGAAVREGYNWMRAAEGLGSETNDVEGLECVLYDRETREESCLECMRESSIYMSMLVNPNAEILNGHISEANYHSVHQPSLSKGTEVEARLKKVDTKEQLAVEVALQSVEVESKLNSENEKTSDTRISTDAGKSKRTGEQGISALTSGIMYETIVESAEQSVADGNERRDRSLSLPSYDEAVERRNIVGLTSRMEKLSLSLEKASNSRNDSLLINNLLQEWRGEQKRAVERPTMTTHPRPILERKTSSDSQSTLDSIDTAPRVLRRRNSMNRRVRFQTPDMTKDENSNKEESIPTRKGESTLATWL